jgi:hypothetical protein
MKHFLLSIPKKFPPKNTTVEPHEYFTKWTVPFSVSFAGVSDDVEMELLVRGMVVLQFCP